VFSPSLVVGALTGLAFGLIATAVFPDVSGSETLYALAGMGAVAAAVLGAPISTALIVFEMTGDWQTGIAVMVSVSLSTALASRLVDKSFFFTQLDRRQVRLSRGPQAYLLRLVPVAQVMRPLDAPDGLPEAELRALIEDGVYIDHSATLEAAMPLFETNGVDVVPVISLGERGTVLRGALHHLDALKAYNRALAAVAREEHD
jgi:chloride channel protein, CIC family